MAVGEIGEIGRLRVFFAPLVRENVQDAGDSKHEVFVIELFVARFLTSGATMGLIKLLVDNLNQIDDVIEPKF